MSEKETWQKMNKEERLRHQLELQSRQIERVFSTHQVPTRVAGGHVETQSIRFDLQSHLESGLHRLRGLKHDLLSVLGVTDVSLVKDERGQWRLDIVRPHEAPVSLLDLLPLLPELPESTAVLGMDEEGAPLLLPFANPDITHALVVGMNGGGKTALLRTMAVSLAMANRQSKLQLLVIDPNQPGRATGELAPLMFLPHLLSQVVDLVNEARSTLQILVDEMYHRLKYETVRPTIVVLIDNAEILFAANDADTEAALAELLQRGAEAGIHLVLATSQPTADWLSSVARTNLPLRLVGQVRDEAESLAATAVPGADAHALLGEGDFLAVADGQVVHFQAAFIGNYDLHLTLETIHRNRPQPLLAQPLWLGEGENDSPAYSWERDGNLPQAVVTDISTNHKDSTLVDIFEDESEEG
ncbi:MAG: AAA family ATPase [Ardenticatenaceae bacterium]|nr:AAA family ATPase [Anaerolineales bacterium]MCB8940654.1 AAA family ATPase [Ardenticatenaceae bacterium]MCB8971984.1 AAA family ATPase [Ardenticatenaceae bacterium]